MIARLIFEELLRLRFERPFIAACGLLILLSAYATWSGQQWQGQRLSAYTTQLATLQTDFTREAQHIAQLERGELAIADAPTAGLPHLARTELPLPVLPTAGLAIGEAELRPTHAAITATTRAHEMFRFQEVDNPILLGWGHFDLAFLVVVLLPLFILGFTCTSLSKEREDGSLSLLLSYPVTARQLALARVSLRTVALVIAVIIGTGLALFFFDYPAPKETAISILAQSDVVGHEGLSTLTRATLFLIASLVNALFWAALALWILSRNQSSELNALWVVWVWMVWVLIVPAIFTSATKLSNPTPSRLEYITAARAAENMASQQGRALLEQYLLDHPELEATRGEAVAPFIKTFVLVQQRVDQSVAPIVARFRAAEEAQHRLADTLRWLSPRELIERNLLVSSGNDSFRFAYFERQADTLRNSWRGAVEQPLIEGRRLTSNEFVNLPRTRYQEPDRHTVLRDYAAHLIVLLAFSLAVILTALRKLDRFSPVITERE